MSSLRSPLKSPTLTTQSLLVLKSRSQIDDDPNFGQLVERFLHTVDPEIDVTRSLDGYDAIKKMRHAPPDLALIDLVLPEFSGVEVIEIMRDTPILDDTRVLLLTAANYSEEIRPAEFSQFTFTLPDNNFPKYQGGHPPQTSWSHFL